MSAFPPPPDLLEYRAPSPRRGFRLGTAVAWLVIVACVGLMVSRERWAGAVRAAKPTTRAVETVGEVRSTQLLMVGRAAVGARALMPPGQERAAEGLIGNVQGVARTPLEELRAIPVVAELKGRDAALDKLDDFRRRHMNEFNAEPPTHLYEDVSRLQRLYVEGRGALSHADVDALISRHGWFGRLAATFGLPDGDQRREEVLGAARRSFLVIVGVMGGAMLAILAGVVLAVVALVRWGNGQVERRYRPTPVAWMAARFGEAFAVYLAAFIGLSVVIALAFPAAGMWGNWALTVVVPLAIGWLRLRGVPWGEVREGLGWHRGRGVLREVGAGVVGYVAGLPVLVVGFVVTFVLVSLSRAQPGHPVQNMPLDAVADKVQVFLLAAVWAPVIEETMFRGAFFHHLRSRLGWWLSTIPVSVVFAAVHPQGLATIPVLMAIAIVLAGIREWRGSIVAPVAAHALHNGVLILMLIGSAG